MKILTRMCTSLDGYVTTADGLPVQLAFPGWDAGALGFYGLQAVCDAVLRPSAGPTAAHTRRS